MSKLLTTRAVMVAALAATITATASGASGAGIGSQHRVNVPIPGNIGGCDSTYESCPPPTASTPYFGGTVGGGGTETTAQVSTENDSQVANYTVPADSTTTIIKMYNDAPAIWQGELDSAFGNIAFASYDRVIQILNPQGTLVQTVHFATTVTPFGAHNQGGSYNGYADSQRGITSYVLSGTDNRGDTTGIISPDGATDNSAYVYPVTNSAQTATITLYNLPALYKLQIGTQFNICQVSKTMPSPGTSWANTSPPSCPGQFPAQGGATETFGGDTRYIVPIQVVNRSNWHTDYSIGATLSATGVSNGSCPAQSYASPVSGCSWSLPSATVGQTYSNSYKTNYSGRTYTQCTVSAVCGGNYTSPTPAWNVTDTSAANQGGSGGGGGGPVCNARSVDRRSNVCQ